MWVGLLVFCLFLLFLSFFLYGLEKWDRLFAASDEPLSENKANENKIIDHPERRTALWLLIIGLTVVGVLTDFYEILNSFF